MRILSLIGLLLAVISATGQTVFRVHEVTAPPTAGNIYILPLSADSLTSSFFIQVRDSVQAHYHQHHTEQIFVLEGTGDMQLGTEVYAISAGDYFLIPAGTEHAVRNTSDEPLKILSIQSPYFDGTDRIYTKD